LTNGNIFSARIHVLRTLYRITGVNALRYDYPINRMNRNKD